MSAEHRILLQGTDGEPIAITHQALQQSATLHTMLTVLKLGPDQIDEPIPLSEISSATLSKVVEWCEHHKEGPPMTADWYQKFAAIDFNNMIALGVAADYLNIRKLMEYCYRATEGLIDLDAVENNLV